MINIRNLSLIFLFSVVMTNPVLAQEQNQTQKLEPKQELLQNIQGIEQTDPNAGRNSPDEAMRVSNQYQTVSNNIKTNGSLVGTTTNQSIFFIPKLHAIIDQIQSLSQNLIDLIMPGGVPQSPDPAKVQEITNKIDAQQKSLTNLLQQPQPNSSMTPTQPGNNPKPDEPFNPANYDRPKQNQFNMYN